MRKALRSFLPAGFLLLAPVFALGDQITFSFVAGQGNAPDLMASDAGGMVSGPADNIAVSDTTLGLHLALPGIFTSSAGPGSSFAIGPSFVIATFTAGGSDSVLIVDPVTGGVLVAGTMQDNGALLAQYPGGTGSYLGTFTVTEVDPAVLAMFGLSGFNPNGSVAFTFGQDQTKSGTLDAVVGGGTVTIVGTLAPEPASLMLAGTGLLALCLGVFRMKRRPNN